MALDWLPEQTRATVESAAEASEAALGEHLLAVCLIGSAAHADRSHRGNAELLVLADDLTDERLRVLAKALTGMLRDGLQVRALTRDELHGSVDVLALEIAEWRAHHVVLAGADPFLELELSGIDMRHEIERALRTLGQRLRNRVLWCMATDHHRRLDTVIREGLDRLIAIGYHALSLRADVAPKDPGVVLAQFVGWIGIDLGPLEALRQRLAADGISDDPMTDLTTLTHATESACEKIDDLLV